MSASCKKSSLLFLLIFFALTKLNATNYTCLAQDKTVIESVIKRYIDLHSPVSSREITIQLVGCQKSYAKVVITPHKPITDPAIAFLHKNNNQWKLIGFGTSFDESLLKQIPAGLKKIPIKNR